MRSRVYIETTIISYLTARPSRDIVLAARQQLTREWWENRRSRFDLYISEVVMQEIRAGDPAAARTRLGLVDGLPLLRAVDEARDLAIGLVRQGVLPTRATEDAAHLALATHHGMDFLLTWNCRHLANAQILHRAYNVIRARRLNPPVVCTPEELMGNEA